MVSRKTENSTAPLTAVMLAGTLRPSPLRRALNRPVLCLPLGNGETVLDAWLRTLHGVVQPLDTRIVCNRSSDVDAMAEALKLRLELLPDNETHRVRAFAEPASWRGAGGVLRDVTRDLDPGAMVVVIESSALPPISLQPILELMQSDEAIAGAVGTCGIDEPAGVFAFRAGALDCVPPVGYFDLKEQLLPALAKVGETVRTARIGSQLVRLRDRAEYLDAVRRTVAEKGGRPNEGRLGEAGYQDVRLGEPGHEGGYLEIARETEISHSAALAGTVVIEPHVVIEDGAVVHDSVILNGARIGGGAVVSASVIGPGATILPRRRVVREVVPSTPSHSAEQVQPGRPRLFPGGRNRERART